MGDLRVGGVAFRYIIAAHSTGLLLPVAACLTHLLSGREQDAHLRTGFHDVGDVTPLGYDTTAVRERIIGALSRDVGTLRRDEHVAHRHNRRESGYVG